MRKLYFPSLVLLGIGLVLLMGAAYRLPSVSAVVLADAVAPTPTRPAPPPLPTDPAPSVTPSFSLPAPPEGALIWLRVQSDSADSRWQDLCTVVQWQDAQGDWHDVNGWRGGLDDFAGGQGRKVWWLPDTLFGAGPFRWQVYLQPRKLVGESSSFYLPDAPHHITWVDVMY